MVKTPDFDSGSAGSIPAGAANPCLHFVGFKGDEYWRAQAVFGKPDFVHRQNDGRFRQELAPGDEVVFANGAEERPSLTYSYNDSEFF